MPIPKEKEKGIKDNPAPAVENQEAKNAETLKKSTDLKQVETVEENPSPLKVDIIEDEETI